MDKIEQIKSIKELFNNGHLSEAEFNELKTEILNNNSDEAPIKHLNSEIATTTQTGKENATIKIENKIDKPTKKTQKTLIYVGICLALICLVVSILYPELHDTSNLDSTNSKNQSGGLSQNKIIDSAISNSNRISLNSQNANNDTSNMDVSEHKKLIFFLKRNGKYILVDSATMGAYGYKEYDEITLYKEELACVSKNGKWGFIDKVGQEVIPCAYDEVDNFSEGLAWVRDGNKYGYIDESGKVVIPFLYNSDESGDSPPLHFSEGLVMVEQNGKCGYIDKTGKEILNCMYQDAGNFSEGLAWVTQDGKSGFIDREGKKNTPFIYDGVSEHRLPSFSEGLAVVGKNGKCGYIDKEGKEVIPFVFDFESNNFSEGLAGVWKNGKCGYIDKNGKEVIHCIYDRVGNFSEGLAKVRQGENWGYIDREGTEVIPFKYNSVEDFSEGFAWVLLNGRAWCIDKKGREYCASQN